MNMAYHGNKHNNNDEEALQKFMNKLISESAAIRN